MSQVRWRVQKPKGKQIGFLATSPFPPNSGNQPLPPGFGQHTGPGTGQQTPSPRLGFNDLMNHTQRWMGMFNHLGPLINNVAPMFRLFQGFGGLPIKYEQTLGANEAINFESQSKKRKIRQKRVNRRAKR